MTDQRLPRTPLTVISILGAIALTLRAVSTLIDNPDFGVPGDGWRSLMQLIVAAALVIAVRRSVPAARRVVGGVAIVYALMTVWERFDGDEVFGLITVTSRDHWAHPAIALLAALTAAFGAGVRRVPRTASVTRTIRASPSALFDIVTDLSMMGRLSPETTECTWVGDGRGIGAVFQGTNTNGGRTWTTTCVVTAFERDHRFSFEVRKPATISRWTYELAAVPGGCEVRETWDDLRNPLVRTISARRSGISDRATHNVGTMSTTLRNLEAVALSNVTGPRR